MSKIEYLCLSWCNATFGLELAQNREERVLRLVEEVLELAQAEGIDEAIVDDLLTRVYRGNKGLRETERQDVAVTFAAYLGNDARNFEDVAARGLASCMARGPMIKKKQAEKKRAGLTANAERDQ